MSLGRNSEARTHTHDIQMPSSTPPPCTSRSGVTLICQEAQGGQIYNDSREQHQVTTVNIYTGLTKDVAGVCGGSRHCRNYSPPQITNQKRFLTIIFNVWMCHCFVMIAGTESDALEKASRCVRLYVAKINGVLIMMHDIIVAHQFHTVTAIYGFRKISPDTSLSHTPSAKFSSVAVIGLKALCQKMPGKPTTSCITLNK